MFSISPASIVAIISYFTTKKKNWNFKNKINKLNQWLALPKRYLMAWIEFHWFPNLIFFFVFAKISLTNVCFNLNVGTFVFNSYPTAYIHQIRLSLASRFFRFSLPLFTHIQTRTFTLSKNTCKQHKIAYFP